MKASGLAAILIAVAALASASSAEAASGFNGKVCGLLSAKQVKAIKGVSTKCKNAPATRGIGSIDHVGNWAGVTAASPRIQVTVSVYADAGMLKLAKRNLKQGLLGPPKKLKGVGTAAYTSTGALGRDVRFSLGKYIVLVNVSGIHKITWTTASVVALAKTVAARLAGG